MRNIGTYPDGPGPPSTAVTALPLRVATQDVTSSLLIERPSSHVLDRNRPHTFRNREIYENAGCRLCSLLEDGNDYARRKKAKKGISIKEAGACPKQGTSITQGKRGDNVPRCCTRCEIVVGIASVC